MKFLGEEGYFAYNSALKTEKIYRETFRLLPMDKRIDLSIRSARPPRGIPPHIQLSKSDASLSQNKIEQHVTWADPIDEATLIDSRKTLKIQGVFHDQFPETPRLPLEELSLHKQLKICKDIANLDLIDPEKLKKTQDKIEELKKKIRESRQSLEATIKPAKVKEHPHKKIRWAEDRAIKEIYHIPSWRDFDPTAHSNMFYTRGQRPEDSLLSKELSIESSEVIHDILSLKTLDPAKKENFKQEQKRMKALKAMNIE